MIESQLTPRTTTAIALLCIVSGAILIAAAVGLVPLTLSAGTPRWVGVAAGVFFVLTGLGVVVGSRRDQRDSLLRRALQFGVGLAIYVAMAAVMTWIAFGPGDRHFKASGSVWFAAWRSRAFTEGRWPFGVAAVVIWTMIVVLLVRSVRGLIISRRR